MRKYKEPAPEISYLSLEEIDKQLDALADNLKMRANFKFKRMNAFRAHQSFASNLVVLIPEPFTLVMQRKGCGHIVVSGCAYSR